MAFGNRKDGRLLKDIDSMHIICPIIYPNRCDNEAFIYEKFDLTNINAFLKEKNYEGINYKYNFFQIIVTAMMKVLYLRPKMNYFIANSNMYERYEKTASFVVKKKFADDGGEGLAFLHTSKDDTLDTIHDKMEKIIYSERKGSNSTNDSMNLVAKLPRFIVKLIARITMFLEKRGLAPQAFIANDPYYASVVLTNLGSIKLHAGYHHLTNWGTNSVFVAVGQIKDREFLNEDGSTSIKPSIDLGLTIDERLADGYYYSRTIALLKVLLENPSLLLEPLDKEVDY